MSITPQAADRKAIVKALEGDYETVAEAAEAVADVAWERYERGARYMVIVQMECPVAEGGGVERNTICLGPFRTERQAEGAISPTVKQQSRWMIVEASTESGTAWVARRREEREAETPKPATQADRLVSWLHERGDIP